MKILLGKKALIIYSILAILVFLIFSPLGEIKISRLLARLSQDLIIQEVNPAREDQGFLALKNNEKLNQAAQLKAEDMIARNYFSHQGPDGESPWYWLDKVEYNYSAAGENLAMDVNDPKVLINAWLNSPSHAKNILNENFTDIGVGMAKGKIGVRETIVVVMFLAKEMSEEPQVLGVLTEKTEEIKNIPPEEPVVSFEQPGENLVISRITEQTNSNKTNFQLVNKFPQTIRLVLSILYSILIFLGVFIIILRKERAVSIVLRPFLLLILILLMYFPSLI
ncbi:MAG: CAP domain-containing protein [bacterium]|nr:CAP domain-containing protein [bacterium]